MAIELPQHLMRFMHDFAKEYNAVPSVREMATGCKQGIRETRRQLARLEDAGLIRRTIRGLAAPKDWKPTP